MTFKDDMFREENGIASEENALPEGWVWARLGDVSTARLGKTPQRTEYRDAGRHRIVKFRDVTDKGIDYSPRKAAYVVDASSILKALRPLHLGDVLITASAHSGDQIGKKCAYVDHLPIVDGGVYFVGELLGVTSIPQVMESKWPCFWFKSEDGIRAVQSAVAGVHLTAGRAQNIPIPLAPLVEQKRIVAKLEELLPRVNAVRERLIRVKEIMKRFRQSVLSAACSGRLTEGWRDLTPITEPAEESLKRVISERAKILDLNRPSADKRGNSRALRKPEIKEPNPEFAADVPDSWAKASMDALTSLVTSGSRAWKRFYVEEGLGTFIMGQNVRPFRLDLSRRVAVDPPEGDPDRRRSEVLEGDLLVSIAGNTGDVCKVSAPLKQHYVCQSVALMRPIFPSMSTFLEMYLNSPLHGQFQMRKWVYGEGRPHLSFDHLKSLCVLVPPFEEQEEIVRRVESLFKLADKIEERVGSELSRAEKMTQAILAKAFRGELIHCNKKLACEESSVDLT